jgi:hypothetical protein
VRQGRCSWRAQWLPHWSWAQASFRTVTAGNEFKLEGLKGKADDVPGGRRFRAGAFEDVTVRAPIHVPASSAADNKLQRLIIRFRASDQGPRLVFAELRGGSQVLYRDTDVDIRGDYSKRETATQPTAANVLNLGGIRAGSDTFIRLTLSFGGGFDSTVNNGEFILIGVEADFSLMPITGHSTVPSADATSLGQHSPADKVHDNGANPVVLGGSSGVIYTVAANNDLDWFRHEGLGDGTFKWAAPAAKKVGSG